MTTATNDRPILATRLSALVDRGHHCDRCGIAVVFRGMCLDCCEVEGVEPQIQFEPAPPAHEIPIVGVRRPNGKVSYHLPNPSPRRVLTAAEIAEIHARTDAGESCNQIAYMMRISSRVVTRWRSRRRTEAAATAA